METEPTPTSTPSTPPIKPKRSRFLRLQYELEKIPKLRGWIIISYTVILIALVISAYFSVFLNPTDQMIFAFSTMIDNTFIILLAAFLGIYLAFLTIFQKTVVGIKEAEIKNMAQHPDLPRLYAILADLKDIRNSVIFSLSIVILIAMTLVFFSTPLLKNPLYSTTAIVILLEMSIVAGWFYLYFLRFIASLAEEMLRSKR